MANQQITNSASLYVDNLPVSFASATTVGVGAGAARDSLNNMDIILDSPLIISAAVKGANGLDVGTLAASSWYAVHVIGDSTKNNRAAALLSLSATAPTLPSTHDSFRRIGWMRTDSSAHFIYIDIFGTGKERVYAYDEFLAAPATSGSTSFATVDLSSIVAPSVNLITLFYVFTGATAGNTLVFRKTGSAGTNLFYATCQVTSRALSDQKELVCDNSQRIDYTTTSASDTVALNIGRFVDYI